ncbi:class I SAM-dependent methyltransferase [Pseudoteredinibacter isoporae]|uniref:SAM-dependent methyltransferase n=1 Tax=Pseudoteredinibacter isoporae TaxID=570281 RepID=A0A7X0JTC1_9GAMM|nr:class I SAM-dependent methyltransferase [Pseudoteredinibacter isoporae]MBB6521877.1 SAM-dependent methyltransferase [Pseudoteredinibacter isoporae]NHO87421.1 class I SAM-dependent methyltransferase [Pseudoteredinibacter isoporae]NIB24248.1 class I SAM-dependent methyltransferase [Pseudoteredinibacter isoporae]
MKVRDSGMPDEGYWAEFFDADSAIKQLIPEKTRQGDWLEVGCGYGTFTLPAARWITGTLSAVDIDMDMVARTKQLGSDAGLGNIHVERRDVISEGVGLPQGSQAGAMVYNLLHLEEPVSLLRKLRDTLKPGGYLSVIHWRSDIPTPRGPDLTIRPTSEQCSEWMYQAGFREVIAIDITQSCPYHFGLLAVN